MKTPLGYQRTEYDCAPTTLLNAVSFQFEREEIPPDMLKFISMYATDAFGTRGEHGKGGTSRLAMMFISGWLNEYHRATGFPVETEYLVGPSVRTVLDGRIVRSVVAGAVVILRVMLGGVEHYILVTGVEGDHALVWDPYFRTQLYSNDLSDILLTDDEPFRANCRVPLARLDAVGEKAFMMGRPENREAVLLFNAAKRVRPPSEPEYMI